ncbi:MAG TPA: hypothetical protein VGC21_08750 [Telluria sp.]|jgi:hypothetical protein
MNRQVKAALRSALIFPGAGQLFLGRRARAAVFALPTLIAAGVFLADIMQPVQAIADELALQIFDGQMVDISGVMARVHALSLGASTGINLAVYVIVGFWAASIVDAWLSAR